MSKLFFLQKHNCPLCGGMVPWSAKQCMHCHGEITWFTRLDWAGECGQFVLVTAALAIGGLFGLIAFHIPKPSSATALSAIILVWFFQITWPRHSRQMEPISRS